MIFKLAISYAAITLLIAWNDIKDWSDEFKSVKFGTKSLMGSYEGVRDNSGQLSVSTAQTVFLWGGIVILAVVWVPWILEKVKKLNSK